MTRLLTVLTILLVCPIMATAHQSADESQPQNSDEVEFRTLEDFGPRESAQLLQPVCAQDVQVIEEVAEHHGAVARCPSCPDGASDPQGHGQLRLEGGYIGDFSGDGNPDAILATMGCGQGFNFRHSTVVLSQSDGAWTKEVYLDTPNSSDCEHIETDDRDWLLCRSTTVGQGTSETFVSLRHLGNSGLESTPVTRLNDSSAGCYFEGEFRKVIDEQVIEDLNDDGTDELALGLRTDIGSVPDEVEEVEDRCNEDSYDITESRSLVVFSLKDDGPEPLEGLESSLEHSDLQEYMSDSEGSEQEDTDDEDDESTGSDSIEIEGNPFEGGGF